MPFFERFLSVWVGLAIVAGVALGLAVPGLFQAVAAFEVAHVNLAVAVFIWVMIYPMMIGVDPSSLMRVAEQPKGLVITLAVNWLVKPFTMAFLGVLFFKHVFAGLIPPAEADGYVAGLILLGAAPCTAMAARWWAAITTTKRCTSRRMLRPRLAAVLSAKGRAHSRSTLASPTTRPLRPVAVCTCTRPPR